MKRKVIKIICIVVVVVLVGGFFYDVRYPVVKIGKNFELTEFDMEFENPRYFKIKGYYNGKKDTYLLDKFDWSLTLFDNDVVSERGPLWIEILLDDEWITIFDTDFRDMKEKNDTNSVVPPSCTLRLFDERSQTTVYEHTLSVPPEFWQKSAYVVSDDRTIICVKLQKPTETKPFLIIDMRNGTVISSEYKVKSNSSIEFEKTSQYIFWSFKNKLYICEASTGKCKTLEIEEGLTISDTIDIEPTWISENEIIFMVSESYKWYEWLPHGKTRFLICFNTETGKYKKYKIPRNMIDWGRMYGTPDCRFVYMYDTKKPTKLYYMEV